MISIDGHHHIRSSVTHQQNFLSNLSAKEILVTNETNVPLEQSYFWIIPMNQEGPTQYKDLFTTELVQR